MEVSIHTRNRFASKHEGQNESHYETPQKRPILCHTSHEGASLEVDNEDSHLLDTADEEDSSIEDAWLESTVHIRIEIRLEILFSSHGRDNHSGKMNSELSQETDKKCRMEDGCQWANA